MSTEELLETRIKIIAGWPGMEDDEYEVGQIHCGNYSDLNKEMIEKYPHLFKPLQWWEEREEKDMPEYLKFRTNGKVRKVEHFNLFIEQIVFEGGRTRRLNKDWTPATESEYNEYLKQLK